MSEPGSDEMDEDLQLALAAFGDDLRDILNEDDESSCEDAGGDLNEDIANSLPSMDATESSTSASINDSVQHVIERYGDKLTGESNLAYAGSIALSCHTVTDSELKTSQRFVVFAVGDQRFALPLSCVVEVVKASEAITQLPQTASWLKGITCLRGNILSVTDPAALFQISSSAADGDKKMIVVNSETEDISTALWVDRILGIRQLESKPMDQSDTNDPLGLVFSGTAEQEGEQVLLIEPDQLLNCSQLATYLK